MNSRPLYSVPTPHVAERDIFCRVLGPDDAGEYRQLRLEALTGEDRCFFTADPEEEKSRSAQGWRDFCVETNERAVTGAFREQRLVAILSVTRWAEDPSGKTAYYGGAYVSPDARHSKAIGALILLQDAWARINGYLRVTFTIRAEKEAFIERQVLGGARIVKKIELRFADGIIAPTCLLERDLWLGADWG